MPSFLQGDRSLRRFLFLGLGLGIVAVGCGARTTPPGPTTIGTSAPGMNITFLKWKKGLTVLFVDDAKGAHSSKGSGSTNNPIHFQSGSAGSVDAGGYKWQIETKDGNSAMCQINGIDYDLAQGALFVIKANDNKAEVNQVKKDLAVIPFDADSCKDPIQKDSDVRKLLALPDLPK